MRRALPFVIAVAVGTPAFADVIAPPCGMSIAVDQVAMMTAFGVLLVPATFGDGAEVRVNAGGGGSYRTSISTYDSRDPDIVTLTAPSTQPLLDAARRTLPDIVWSASGRRRLGSSRFNYRTFTLSQLTSGGCALEVEARMRVGAGFSVDAVRGELFQLELGLGPVFGLAPVGQDSDWGRATLGAAPFLRLAVDDPAQPVAVELTLYYLLQAGLQGGLFHGGQGDLTFSMRFPALTVTATARGEIGHSQYGLRGTVLMLSASGLLGVRMPRS